jgi:hypothetical protein
MLLAFASGCSRGSESEISLSPVLDERGLITYRYMSAGPDARPDAPPVKGPDVVLQLRQLQEEQAWIRQRQRDEQAEQNRRRSEQIGWRIQEYQRQRDEQAEQDRWRRARRDQDRQRWQEQRDYRQQQQQQRLQDEANGQQQASRELDRALQRMLQPQETQLWQRW